MRMFKNLVRQKYLASEKQSIQKRVLTIVCLTKSADLADKNMSKALHYMKQEE